MKEKFELEYLFKTTPGVLENLISTPSGLSEWFADDVNVKNNIYTFKWDGATEDAQLQFHKMNQRIRFKWLADEEDEYYFEIATKIDPMTNAMIINITDYAEPDDINGAEMLWDQQMEKLRRILGA
jgi:uncharacterized protein YndB with AHSA1/START domain